MSERNVQPGTAIHQDKYHCLLVPGLAYCYAHADCLCLDVSESVRWGERGERECLHMANLLLWHVLANQKQDRVCATNRKPAGPSSAVLDIAQVTSTQTAAGVLNSLDGAIKFKFFEEN